MKILAPIREFDELEMLVASGAEELYCGVVPREYLEKYPGALWLNRRAAAGSGMESFAELRRLSDEAHSQGLPVFVTLNAPTYGGEQLNMVLDLAERMSEESGADALIYSCDEQHGGGASAPAPAICFRRSSRRAGPGSGG